MESAETTHLTDLGTAPDPPDTPPEASWVSDTAVVETGLASFLLEAGGAEAAEAYTIRPEAGRLVPEDFDALPELIIDLMRLNDVRRVNRRMLQVNRCLPDGGRFAFRAQNLRHRVRQARMRWRWVPLVVFKAAYAVDFVIHRILPKLPGTKQVYFEISRGFGRAMSKSEVYGRLAYCGFEVLATRAEKDVMLFLAKKVAKPRSDPDPSYGPICRIRRVGEGGKIIHVYKLRTMHPYSEYIQAYVYRKNQLAAGGKFRRDFRVTRWGRVLRRLWIDELPMLWNWLRGDLKLVGVRPLTEHYLSLYDEEFRTYRQRFKPGLVPPFYADLPTTVEEIVASERAYLEAYAERPARTDARYLIRSFVNIVFRGARSG